VVSALRDAVEGSPLQQIQIIKGWVDAEGQSRETVVTVAGSADASGAETLCAVWRDEQFDAARTAWYYARVLETPTQRWSARICEGAGVRCEDKSTIGEGLEACCAAANQPQLQERAWSSPIWVSP
jgi:hypothetical protein